MKKVSIALLIFMLCIFSYSKFSIVSAEQPKTIDELFSLSTLYDNNNGYQSYHASSYDLEEGNLDGVYFNKLENIQYTTTLLEVEGPGAITRFWTAGYSHHEEIKTIQIYVDGKLLIDCKALDFFNGLYKPFIKPYVGLGNETGGGVYCYVPIVFQKSIRITGQYVNYYNIDYTLFPKDYVVTSTTITDEPVVPSWYKDNTHALDAICDGEITTEDYQLIAGNTTTIYVDNAPGVLQGFNINIENLTKSTEKCSQFSESGRYIKAGGEISFDMNLNPNNKGAYLKYRIDTIWSNLIVDVYVDNTYVGRSEAGPSNSEYRFKDLYIQIPKNLTENKSEVRVKFEVVSIDGLDAPFNNFWMYSVLDEGTILTDFLDLLNGKNESLNNLEYTFNNGSGVVNADLNDPSFTIDIKNYDFQENADAILGKEQTLCYNTSDSSIEFNINVSGNKDLVLIQRTKSSLNQSTIVWVDGKKNGTWNIFGDGVGSLMESQYNISASALNGKTNVKINLKASSECNIESLYIYEQNGSNLELVDQIKFYTDTTHNVKGTNRFEEVNYQGVNTILPQWQEVYDVIQNSIDPHEILVKTHIKVYYDNQAIPDIDTNLAMFIGMGMYNYYKVESVVSGITDSGLVYFYLPISYRRVKIDLYVEDDGVTLNNVSISFARKELDKNTDLEHLQLLKTQYTYYESTKKNEQMNWLTATGSGKLVGIELCMEGAKSFEYLEGDEMVTIDGNKSHILYGTGCEDIFNSAWYYVGGCFTQSMHGCTTAQVYSATRGRNATYRWFIMDQINFRDGILATIEHGPQNLTEGEEVHMLAFYYHTEESELTKIDEVSYENVDVVSGTFEYTEVIGRLEGNYAGDSCYEQARILEGKSRFKVEIPKNSDSILLRRLYSMSRVNQKAKVYVDGKYVGVWENKYNRGHNEIVRYDDFIIPNQYILGKEEITVEFETVDGYVFDEAIYEVFAVGYNVVLDNGIEYDVDNDGINDLEDEEILIESINITSKFAYQNTTDLEIKMIGSNLSISQKESILEKLANKNYSVMQSFGIEIKQKGSEIEFNNLFEVTISTNLTGTAIIVYYDDYNSINIINATIVDNTIKFDIYCGGQFIIIQ